MKYKILSLLAFALLLSHSKAATLTVTIPDAVSTNILLRVSNTYDYTNKRSSTNETRKAFVERLLAEHLRQLYLASKKDDAVLTATTNTTSTVDAEFPKP